VTVVLVLREREKSAVGRSGESRGSHRPFIGAGARQRGVARGSNDSINGFNAIEDGVRLRGGLRGGGSDGGAVMAQAASRGAERAARGAAARWNLVATRPGSAGAVWKTELTAGARLTER
jgi:hypothetical protein